MKAGFFATTLVALVMLLTPVVGVTQNTYVPNGHVTGARYMKLTADEQRAFVIGVIGGLLAAGPMGGDQSKVLRLESCLLQMEATQLVAMVNKWVSENPSRWHNGLNAGIWLTMRQACNL